MDKICAINNEETNEMRKNGQKQADWKNIISGLIYTHNRANKNTSELHHANATLQTVVELLVEQGVLDLKELASRNREKSEKLQKAYIKRGMAVAMQEFKESKYDFKGSAELDCENRIHLCKAACCRLPLALSKEDVQEGIVRWDLGQPYMIAHSADGYCVHLDQGSCHCRVYEHRPIPCRGYDCCQDKRIWLDFDKKIINPRIHEMNWPECFKEEKNTVDFGEDQKI